MTEEEINIAIAEACGLFKIEPLRRTTRKGKTDPNGVVLWYCEEHHGGAATYARVPDYCNDLNAMHEAIKHLSKRPPIYIPGVAISDPIELFEDYLLGICDSISLSTASQQAIALVKTLNLWK